MKKFLLLKFLFLVICTGQLLAQTKAISGKLTSSDDGAPLPGVNIVVKGSTTGTTSDADGSFSISVAETDVLIVSFIGYMTKEIPVGTLDISLYRDDLTTLGPKPVVQKTDIGVPVASKVVVLIDDVLYTGRTVRAAMDALFAHGRPRLVQFCVLIDRGHRELPVEATFVGRRIQTQESEIVEVQLKETDDAERVLLVEKVS